MLAEALFQSIRHAARASSGIAPSASDAAPRSTARRTPLNNGGWLRAQFARIGALPDEEARLAAIDRHRPLDRSRPWRLLRRPRQSGAAAAASGDRGVPFAEDPQRLKSGADRLRLSSRLAIVLDDPRRIVLGCAAEAAVHRTSIRSARYKSARRLRGRRVQHGYADPARRQRQLRNLTAHAEAVPVAAAGVRHPGRGDARRRADADFSRTAGTRQRGPRQPDRGSVADADEQ